MGWLSADGWCDGGDTVRPHAPRRRPFVPSVEGHRPERIDPAVTLAWHTLPERTRARPRTLPLGSNWVPQALDTDEAVQTVWCVPGQTPAVRPRIRLGQNGEPQEYRLTVTWLSDAARPGRPPAGKVSPGGRAVGWPIEDDAQVQAPWHAEWTAPQSRGVVCARQPGAGLPVAYEGDSHDWVSASTSSTTRARSMKRAVRPENADTSPQEIVASLEHALAPAWAAPLAPTPWPRRRHTPTAQLPPDPAEVLTQLENALAPAWVVPTGRPGRPGQGRSSPTTEYTAWTTTAPTLAGEYAAAWVPLPRPRPAQPPVHTGQMGTRLAPELEVYWIAHEGPLPRPRPAPPRLGQQVLQVDPESYRPPLPWQESPGPTPARRRASTGRQDTPEADPLPVPLPWVQTVTPGRPARPVRTTHYQVAPPEPLAVGLVIVTGPYRVITMDIYCAGAVAGEVCSP